MREKLTPERLTEALSALHGWISLKDKIEKVFEFNTYKDGLVFACAVGYIADAMDHHPDMTIGYRKVVVQLSTHDAEGITETDIRQASMIEALALKGTK